MKRTTLLAAIAVCLLALWAGLLLLLVGVALLAAYFAISYQERRGDPSADACQPTFASIEEVTQAYGEPDGTVVLNALKADELSSLVLFYPQQDKAVVAGQELRISDMTSVMPKNMATPYTVDEYAVILTTCNPQYPTIRLRVGYDGGLAREIADQIFAFIPHQQ